MSPTPTSTPASASSDVVSMSRMTILAAMVCWLLVQSLSASGAILEREIFGPQPLASRRLSLIGEPCHSPSYKLGEDLPLRQRHSARASRGQLHTLPSRVRSHNRSFRVWKD